MRFTIRRHAAALAALLVACGGGGGGSALDGGDRPLAWDRDVAWEAGGFDATDWDVFGDVTAVAFDGRGNLHILDRQAFRVTVVSPEGEPIRTYGAQGEGPGELNSPVGLVVFRDGSSAVQDFSKSGFVTYDPSGEWAGDVSWRSEGLMIVLGRMAPAGDRTFFAERDIQMRMGGPADGEGEEEPPGDPIVRVDLASGEVPEVLFRAWDPPDPEGPTEEVEMATARGGFRLQLDPLRAFTPDLEFTGLGDGRFAVVDSTTYSIRILDRTGAVVGEISRPIDPIPVTESIRNAERERRLAELRADEDDPMQMNEAQTRRVENMLFWPEIPVVDALAADWRNRLWVTRGARPGEDAPIDVVTSEGEYVGTLSSSRLPAPAAFGPEGLAAWIERDDFDAETVVVGRIVEGDPPGER